VDAETGLIIDCNQALTALVGRDKAELIGKPQTILHPPAKDNGQFSSTFRQHLSDKAGEILDTQVVSKTGEVREVAIKARTVNLAGKMVMHGLFRDITDRKRAEEALLEFKTAVEQSMDGIALADLDGHIRFVNEAWARLHGYRVDELIGRHLGIFHTKEQLDTEVNPFNQQVLKNGSAEGEVGHARKDGTTFPMRMTVTVLLDAHQKPFELLGIARDITQSKRAEQELIQASHAAEAANRAKSEFLTNMSHEIRTPMTAILGYADLMLDENVGRTTREHVAVIKRNGEHLLGLISDILDLSKIEAGKLQIEPTRCSPVQVVAEVVSLMRPQAAAKQLKLKTELAQPLPEAVLTDPLRLRQVLVNLVGNAIKFTEQGEVRLAVRLNANSGRLSLCFDVTDTGIGMNEEQIGRLFKPFSQVDNSSTRKFGGTGLGLCISKHLAEALGGDIEVRSEPGKGSTFSLTIDPGLLDGLHMVEDAQKAATEPPPTAPPAGADKIALCGRILLAEDMMENQRLICLLLRNAGADVVAVENGQLAAEAAMAAREAGDPFDVILMDMQMPVMNGYEATRQLRKRGYTGPIVALTAHAMAEDCQKCLAAGCNDYLPKPFQHRTLLKMVAWHIPAEKGDKLVYSHLASDPDLGAIIDLFVQEMPDRINALDAQAKSRNWNQLAETAHQIKGAAGCYGFDEITPCAARLEAAAREAQQEEQILSALDELLALCRRVRSGKPQADQAPLNAAVPVPLS
jgi:PAS domain S-box-containing protein